MEKGERDVDQTECIAVCCSVMQRGAACQAAFCCAGLQCLAIAVAERKVHHQRLHTPTRLQKKQKICALMYQ